MRRFLIIAAAAGLTASPAAAQVSAGANVGAKANAGGLVDGVTKTADRAVGAADRLVNKAGQAGLALASRTDVRAGIAVRDARGTRIGTVQSVGAEHAVVVSGKHQVHVPLNGLYRGSKGLVSNLTKAQIAVYTRAHAGAHAHH